MTTSNKRRRGLLARQIHEGEVGPVILCCALLLSCGGPLSWEVRIAESGLRPVYGALRGRHAALRILKGLGGSNPPLSATESLSLGIFCASRQIARASAFFRSQAVAEKIAFRWMMLYSRQKSLWANSARPFGLEAEREDDGQRRRYTTVLSLRRHGRSRPL